MAVRVSRRKQILPCTERYSLPAFRLTGYLSAKKREMSSSSEIPTREAVYGRVPTTKMRGHARTHTLSVVLLEKIGFKRWVEGWEWAGWLDFVRERVPDRRWCIKKRPLKGECVNWVKRVSDWTFGMWTNCTYLFVFMLSTSPEGRPGMSDVSPLSGISGLSFDSTLLSPLLFFCLVLLPFLSYCFLPAGPFFSTFSRKFFNIFR